MTRFTLYGSPHSLPTYKVALMLHMSGEPFSFRYVSFQRGIHTTPEFRSLSRWGQVPVLLDNGSVRLQATAIVEHLTETLGRFQGTDPDVRQLVREWLYWEVDALFPPIFNCYGVQLGKQKLLPISVKPAVADYHRQRAEAALSTLDSHLRHGNYLCSEKPTIADLVCRCDVAFAEISAIELRKWKNVCDWAARIASLSGFKPPLELLPMANAEISCGP
jgi:glutathione S-transferase